MAQHIIGLTAENVKRLSAVRIKLDKDARTVILSGANAQGKSSVLDCITMALCGKESIPGQPIRTGQKNAQIILETEEMIVTRTFTETDSYLNVANKDGFKAQSPQKLLDAMIERIGFDPLQFAKMDKKSQSATLLKIFPAPIDLDANAVKAKAAYDARADANREVKRISGMLANLPEVPADTPTAEVSVSALANELSDLRAKERKQQIKIDERVALDSRMSRQAETIAILEEQLEAARDTFRHMQEQITAMDAEPRGDFVERITAVETKLQNAESENRKVRALQARKTAETSLTDATAVAKKHEDELTAIMAERAAALKQTKFPVEGLSIGEDGGVTFNGVPFDQASSAQQIMVGIAIGAAANTKIRVVMIRDASLLDSKSMQMVAEMAEKLDLQIWMERVEDNSPAAIQIVDGSNLNAADTEQFNLDNKPKEKRKKAPVAKVNSEIPY